MGADGELFMVAEFDLASTSLFSSSSPESDGSFCNCCVIKGLCVLEFLDKVSVLFFPSVLNDGFLDKFLVNSNLSSLIKDRKKYMLTFLLIW